MADSADRRRGAYVPTGWRIVGRDADQIARRATVAAADVAPGRDEDTLFAVQCTVAARNGAAAVERVLDAVTDELRRGWPECPRLLRDERAGREASRFGGFRFDFVREPGNQWTGELVWRAVHPVVPGAPITTQLVIEERATFTRITVRVTADDGVGSVRGYVGAGQAQPHFLRALRDDVELTWLGAPVRPQPLRAGEPKHFVPAVLEGERDIPVVVLAPLEEGGFVIDPAELARDLLGRAQLYVIEEHRVTFELTDTVGDRRMSCYWGAARCYFPDWTRYDDPREHPLLVRDRLEDPVLRATWLGEIGMWTATGFEMPPGVDERRTGAPARRKSAAPAAVPAAQASVPAEHADARAPVVEPAAATAPEAAALAPLLQHVAGDVRGLAAAVSELREEIERLRTISAVRSAGTSAIERRLGRLEDLIAAAFAPPAADAEAQPAEPAADYEEGAASLVDVVHDAAETHGDALLFLDAAYSSAANSPYEDPERVRAILDAMARVARRRRDGVLGTSLREALGDLGIDYRPAIARGTPARLREQYRFRMPDGVLVEAEEHIALGGTYDPRRCLRIYFSSRVPDEPRFVIAHVGRHFEVQTSS